MPRLPMRQLLTATAFAILSTTVLAQTTPTPQPPASGAPQSNTGLGPTTTNPSQVDKGQNMILPSAGQSAPSAAPTMVFDCKAKPQDCTTPTTPADKADMPDISAPPATSTPKP